MSYESNTGLGVKNQYGPRASGGSEDITKTAGSENEWSYDSSDLGLGLGFPSPGTGEDTIYIIDVSAAIPSQTVTALNIGGVSVFNASLTNPVAIAAGNTGIITGKAGTAAGRIFIKYLKSPTA